MFKVSQFSLPLNLQLFSEEEEEEFFLDDEEEQEEKEEEKEEEQEEQEEQEEELEDDEQVDKKTKAIIKHKKENKELKRQLQELQEKMEANELAKETSTRILELTKTGKTTAEATKIANDEIEVKKLRLQLAKFEIQGLETKYPGISLFARQLAEDKSKLPEFSYEQLYLAKYSKSNQYDEKTKLEQELLYKTKEARSKSLEGSNSKAAKTTKLSAEEERVYQRVKKYNPNMTRKQFKALAESNSLEE